MSETLVHEKIEMIHGMEKHAQYFLIYAQISHVFECICREHMISLMFPKSFHSLLKHWWYHVNVFIQYFINISSVSIVIAIICYPFEEYGILNCFRAAVQRSHLSSEGYYWQSQHDDCITVCWNMILKTEKYSI